MPFQVQFKSIEALEAENHLLEQMKNFWEPQIVGKPSLIYHDSYKYSTSK